MVASRSPWKEAFFSGIPLTNVDDFRSRVPLTRYSDYRQFFEADGLNLFPDEQISWACTTGSAGKPKWVPFTKRALDWLGDMGMSAMLLAAARYWGDVRIGPGSNVLYSVAPSPYLTGLVAQVLHERFGLRPIPPLDITYRMGFQERIEAGLQEALSTGVDVICSMSSVLIRIGEHLANEERTSGRRLNPSALPRLARGWFLSKVHHRPILPCDLWRPKAVVSWGLDTSLYREHIKALWGQEPYEFEACTEAGILAVQGMTRQWMTPVPYSAFLEFLPVGRESPSSNGVKPVETCLLSELETGERYELVVTSFYGMPFVRYRTGHLIRVMAQEDRVGQIALPQLSLIGRTNSVIDLAGFTRLDEKTLAEAVSRCTQGYVEWIARKEFADGHPVLHFYIDGQIDGRPGLMKQELHERLKDLDVSYRDLDSMLKLNPIKVTLLSPGSFHLYHASILDGDGVSKGPIKRVNPSEESLMGLLQAANLG